MSEINELYQALILDHNASPRNFGPMSDATHQAKGHNPLCGDRFDVYVRLGENDRIEAVQFEGSGCAISKASASLMTTLLTGKSVAEANALFERFHKLVTGESDDDEGLGKAAVFSGVREYPARVKCASLSWHTVHGALSGAGKPVSTE